MIRVCLSGLGKTGTEIARTLLEEDDIELVSVVCRPGSDKIGHDLGEIIGTRATGIRVDGSEQLIETIKRTRPDVAVDFSNPEASLYCAGVYSEAGIPLVIGTTGFTKVQMMNLYLLTQTHGSGIVYAPNITLGVNVLMLVANLASNLLNSYDFQITEVHHKHKKDSPSGTANKILAEIERGIAASGNTDPCKQIPISAIRVGGVVGRHEVMIVGENDKIELSHESFSRKAFALGALKAIRFIHGKSGYFEMNDVLNLSGVLMDYLEHETRIKRQRSKASVHAITKRRSPQP